MCTRLLPILKFGGLGLKQQQQSAVIPNCLEHKKKLLAYQTLFKPKRNDVFWTTVIIFLD